MTSSDGFRCGCCGERHGDPPLAFAVEAPAYWSPELAGDPTSVLEDEVCIIQARAYLVRGLVQIPVVDTGEIFAWNAWVSLSRDNFVRMQEVWETPGREAEQPYFGWFSNELPCYSVSTLELKANLHTRPLGQRPLIELEPTDHPLAVEQSEGITRLRLQEIAEALLHGN